jgi:hypothetical protein
VFLACKPPRAWALPAALIAAAWFGGYGLTWLSKWVMTAMVEGSTVRDAILSEISFRLVGAEAHVVLWSLRSTGLTLVRVAERYVGVVIIAATVLYIARTLKGAGEFAPRRFAILALPALIPVMWFELLQNHTQIHSAMASRSMAGAIGVLLASWVLGRSAPTDAAAAQALPAHAAGGRS